MRIGLTSRKHEHTSLPVHERRDRRGVAWSPLGACPPGLAPRRLVEPHDAWSTGGAHVDDQQAPLHQRSGRGAEEILGDLVLDSQIVLPDNPTRSELQAVHLPFRANRVHELFVDDRTRARAVVVTVPILEHRSVAELPPTRSGLGVQALDDLVVPQPVQVDESISRDRRRCISGPFGELPDEGRGKRPAQFRLGRDCVVRGPEERGPVGGHGTGWKRLRSPMETCLSGRETGAEHLTGYRHQHRSTREHAGPSRRSWETSSAPANGRDRAGSRAGQTLS